MKRGESKLIDNGHAIIRIKRAAFAKPTYYLTIMTPSYTDEGAFFPAESISDVYLSEEQARALIEAFTPTQEEAPK